MAQPSEQIEAFRQAIEALEQADISYAITGSWVISAYGIVRATHDLDLIIAVQGGEAGRIVLAFPSPRYYADEAAIAEGLATRSFFNIIDMDSGLKIDFWPLKDDEYSQTQFRRRQTATIEGRTAWLLSPEDIILAKLLWFKMSESERQWRDIMSVWQALQDGLDQGYLKTWAARLSIADLFAKITNL